MTSLLRTSQICAVVFYFTSVSTHAVDSPKIAKIRSAAEQGNADAQFQLGRAYLFGKGVPEDIAQSVKWELKAAEQGHAEAQVSVGDCYYMGLVVPKDFSEAVKWYRRAAERGNPFGQHNLGKCYFNGHGVNKDFNEAVKWYRKSIAWGTMCTKPDAAEKAAEKLVNQSRTRGKSK